MKRYKLIQRDKRTGEEKTVVDNYKSRGSLVGASKTSWWGLFARQDVESGKYECFIVEEVYKPVETNREPFKLDT